MKSTQTNKTATAWQKTPDLRVPTPEELVPIEQQAQHSPLHVAGKRDGLFAIHDENGLPIANTFREENARLIVRSVNHAEALAEALRDVELRTTQARIASGIGKRKNQTEFLLGELERIAGAAHEALARWEAK